MGLLDEFSSFIKTPEGIGLLSAAAGMAAGARRGTPWNNLGRGALAGLTGYADAIERQQLAEQQAQAKQLRDLQIKQAQAQLADAEASQKFFADPSRWMISPAQQALANGQGPTVENAAKLPALAPQFDVKGMYQGMLTSGSPTLAQSAMKALAEPEEWDTTPRYDQQGRAFVTSKSGRIKYLDGIAERVDPNKPFRYDASGNIVPNTPFQQYEILKAERSAPRTTVNNKIDNKTGESIAGQIGPMLKDSRMQAIGAVKMADSAERLETALNSGKVIAGPMATSRMFMNQLATSMGIKGPEAVTQTRQAIRALAETAVEARKELAGQGQVTENEAKAVEKAMSGNIDDMTVPELKALVSLNKKAAKLTAQRHQALLNEVSGRDDLKGMVGFYVVPGMERVLNYSFDVPQSNNGWSAERK